MDGVLEALTVLEERRNKLHTALREAAFSYSNTQWIEEKRGRLVSSEAVPVTPGALTPLVTILTTSLSPSPSSSSPCTAREESSLGGKEDKWTLKVEVEKGEEPPQTLKNYLSAVAYDDEDREKDGREGHTASLIDPLYYFSAVPSAELKETRAYYEEVIRQAVLVVEAQMAVMSMLS